MSGMMDKRLAEWFASWDTGTSSKAIALWLAAGVKEARWGASTPSDPADLARCLRLLQKVPEFKSRISEMAKAGGRWPTLLKYWDQIVASFLAEVGGEVPTYGVDWKAPKTYALMKAAEDEAFASPDSHLTKVDLGGASVVFRKS